MWAQPGRLPSISILTEARPDQLFLQVLLEGCTVVLINTDSEARLSTD